LLAVPDEVGVIEQCKTRCPLFSAGEVVCFSGLQDSCRLRPEVCHERGETVGRSSPNRPSHGVWEMGHNSAPALRCPL